jgi:hypothetical protein
VVELVQQNEKQQWLVAFPANKKKNIEKEMLKKQQ